MASNSLLECVVFAKSSARSIKLNLDSKIIDLPDWDSSKVIRAGENIVIAHNWDATRRLMWDYVGVVRSNNRLEMAKEKIKLIFEEVENFYKNFEISSDFIELRNLVLVARIIIESAIKRKKVEVCIIQSITRNLASKPYHQACPKIIWNFKLFFLQNISHRQDPY